METSPLSTRNSPLTHKYAFTLVEVLIVMAIIAVLAGITFPVFAFARRSAQRSACINNMHQLSVNMHLYLQDYNGVFPSFRIDPQNRTHADDLAYWHDRFCQGRSPDGISWVSVLTPYGRSQSSDENYLHCPAEHHPYTPQATSYELKMWLALGRNDFEIPSPTDLALFWEQWSFHDAVPTSEYDRRSNLLIAFFDGHAKPVALEKTTSARYGSGPDLHWFFNAPDSKTQGLGGHDIID